MHTKERLAKELEANNAPAIMVEAARAGFYDDFESSLPNPIMHLVSDLREEGLHALAQRAMDGEFDASKEEAEAWFADEGRHLIR